MMMLPPHPCPSGAWERPRGSQPWGWFDGKTGSSGLGGKGWGEWGSEAGLAAGRGAESAPVRFREVSHG